MGRVCLHTAIKAVLGEYSPVMAACKTRGVIDGAMTLRDKANYETVITLLNQALATTIINILRYNGVASRCAQCNPLTTAMRRHISCEGNIKDRVIRVIRQKLGLPNDYLIRSSAEWRYPWAALD
jgi:hypothetical protein